ncbi:MAG TPA: hypothetical protein PLE66_08675 [Thauera aminoaromatica]|nr:hypothetical protein [Burkholderiaceae bacterium]HMZ29719.1 hypothetical protein [Thauera aminoaromatica]HNB43001.1 hypothetical protein [Burkholderiaceae bacterium]HNG77847.1 hypothetical protein [Burkholderiaceae bacterium]
MSESKDPPKSGFFRKVVRFALNPTTDWADLNNSNSEPSDDDAARSEIKAMIERKRRNDFVRKREFDMLRKIRREGLTGEGIAGLDGLSHLDDSEVRINDGGGARPDHDVKDKIDAIERQMVGETPSAPARRGAAVMRTVSPALSDAFFSATTAPQVMATSPVLTDAFKPTAPMHLLEPIPAPAAASRPGAPSDMMGKGVSALSPLYGEGSDASNAFAFEVNELAHDAELDEAVIAFANADFDLCERVLQTLVAAGGLRAQHSDTWLALFDLYRATGQQQKFETLAMDYVQRFGWSAPQWYSLPRMVAEQAAHDRPRSKASGSAPRADGTVGWVAPELLDGDGVAQLRSQLLQLPLPWVLDWRQSRRIDAQACTALARLLHEWADQPVEMRWIGGERFFQLLSEAAPTGVRDADPAYWMLRLETLRLANRAPDFDQTAIDYCMTYEVSPPSWAPARCTLTMASVSGVTITPPMTADVSTAFMESEPLEERSPAVANVELNGQLVGDIGALLKELDTQIGQAGLINVSCARLIRVDFIAAGDLLNWVLARRGENRAVTFVDAHRLVALFCGAMGINEHARVTVRSV